MKYDKQDQQGKAAFNERNPHTTQQQESLIISENFDQIPRTIFHLEHNPIDLG
jgi:hypothetical protein